MKGTMNLAFNLHRYEEGIFIMFIFVTNLDLQRVLLYWGN